MQQNSNGEKNSDLQTRFPKNSIKYVFDALYHSGNSAQAVCSALALVASHFSFERGYIFETDKGGKTTSNTFEWCADGITAEIDNLQHVPIEAASTANKSFYKTGVFVLKSLDDLAQDERKFLEPQGIKSMFQFGIFSNKKLLGFIGFDNCRSGALLNDAEIDEIAAICNILAAFFIKQRNDESFSKDIEIQLDVMNHLNNDVYIVEPNTFELLFMNNQTRKRMKNIKKATRCYEFFRGRNAQCDDCPIKGMQDEKNQQVTREIYNKKLEIWEEASASILNWKDGHHVYLIECADITKQKKEHQLHIAQLEKLAFVDELTQSRTFYKFKEDARKILQRQLDIGHFLVKLDIENFKLINQIYGYEKGDDILRNMAMALKMTARNDDEIFARVSNDEFIALFSIDDDGAVEKLNDDFSNNFFSLIDKDFAFKFTFAYGVYVIKPHSVDEFDIKDLFEKANVAHKAAKFDKSHKIVIYDETMIEKALRIKEIENKMSKAISNNEFVVYLQPKYYLDSEMISGAEALTRWQNENVDLFFPNAFIPIFERNGFITKLDFYILNKVCCIIKSWLENGIEPVVVSVNFSRLHLSNRDFVKKLCQEVDNVGIDRKYIEIEITETAIYDNIETLVVLLDELHKSGFSMSMDDFGSGYSSLGMLKDLAVDMIKMDGSFFTNPKDAKRSKIVVGNVIKMAEELGIRIVAEGVEEQKQIDFLRELHCDMVQGYYYAKPMPSEKFTELIRKPTKFKRKV